MEYDSGDENDVVFYPWTGIVVNILKDPTDSEKDVENPEYWMKRFEIYKPETVEILWDDQKQTALAFLRFNIFENGYDNALEFDKAFKADNHGKKQWSHVCENGSSASVYGWVARLNDWESQGPIGDYLGLQQELQTISDLDQQAQRQAQRKMKKSVLNSDDSMEKLKKINDSWVEEQKKKEALMDAETRKLKDERKKIDGGIIKRVFEVVTKLDTKKDLEMEIEELKKKLQMTKYLGSKNYAAILEKIKEMNKELQAKIEETKVQKVKPADKVEL